MTDAAFGWGIVPSYPRPDHRFPPPASLDSTDTRAQSLKRLVYEAREDPTKVQAYVDGLKAEINKVGNTPLDRRERQRTRKRIFSRTSNLKSPQSREPFGASLLTRRPPHDVTHAGERFLHV